MPAIGAEVADAYIEVHADTGPFRRELRREATLAAREASDEFGTEFTKAIDRDLDPLGARVAESLREMGELGGRNLIEEVADQVRSRADRINTAFAQSITFGDFAPFIESFNNFDDAIEDFDTRLRELNRDGTLTNQTFDRLNASFNAYVRTLQDSAIADALARDRDEAIQFEQANERLIVSLDKSSESARRFNIGLGSLKGSRNDFLNFIGSLAGFLERNIGRGLEGLFTGVGNGISRLGASLSEVNGPLGAVGRGLGSFGANINKLGAGGLDGLIIQVAALVIGLQLLIGVLGPIAAGISGLASAFTALAVGVGGALLGGIVALGPALTALAAGAGAVAIGFSKLDKAQKAIFKPLQDLFKEVRTSIQERLFDGLGGQVDGLTAALAPLGPFLTNLAGVFADWVSEVVGEIGPGGPLADTFASLGEDLPVIFRTLLDLISAVGGSLAGLFAGAAPGAQRLFEGITGVVEQFSAWVNTSAGQQAINNFMQQAVDILTTLWNIAKQVGIALGELWGGGAQQAAQTLLTLVQNLVTRFAEWLGDSANRQALIDFFRNGVRVATSFGTIIGALISLFDSLDTQFTRAGFQFLVNQVVAAINAFRSFTTWTQNILQAIGNFGVRAVAVANQIGSLGTRAAQAGQSFRNSLGAAFNAVGGFIQTQIRGFIAFGNTIASFVSRGVAALARFVASGVAMVNRVGAGLRMLAGIAGSALAGFVASIQRGASAALGRLVQFGTSAVGTLSRLPGQFVALGADIMRGLYNGVVGSAGRVISYIQGLAGDVAAAFANVLGIDSPSKVFARLGGFTIDGLIVGMRRRKKAAEKESGNVAEGVIQSAIDTYQRAQGSIRNTARMVTAALASAGDDPVISNAFRQLGVRAIRSLTNGLDNGREAAQKEIKDIVERISEVARAAMKGEDKKTRASIVAQSAALQQWVRGQGQALDAIWREVDRAGTRIETARDRLRELQQEFTQLRESTRDSLRRELDLSGGIQDDGTATFESVASQVSGLAARMKKFAGLIKRLIKAGFPPALVQEVAALGSTEGIAVANALLSGTKAQQRDLIADFGSVQQASDQIGVALAEQMFRTGIEAQKGLIRGLEANRDALIKAAKRIAKTITDEIKRELGIKSPSTVFRQLGEFIVEGLALGIESGTDRVGRAVTGLVDPNALDNVNAPISSLAAGQTASGGAGAGAGGIASGAIQIVTPYANPRLVALEVMDALAARGK